ncbi:MAG: sulfotransferase [Myxococcota bacterium]|nr:sulfotransferase [Myxococcota bacterium]
MNPAQDKLKNEPPLSPAGMGEACLFIIKQILLLLLTTPLALVFGIPYLVLRLGISRPPNLPNPKTVKRYLKKAIFAHDEVHPSMRIRLVLSILLFLSACPLLAFAWYIDDIFFPEYRKTTIVKPLFLITGSRSGSTQLAQYLEDNPQIVSHPFLMQSFPYIWLWKLMPKLFGKFLTEEKILNMLKDAIRPEFLERKELHPFKPETYEVVFSVSQLINHSMVMGPQMFAEGYGWGRSVPENRYYWEEDLVNNIDAIGKKLLFFSGPNPDGTPKTLFIKGHFLASASILEKKYPDAHFLTVLRHPSKRIRSIINFFRVAPEVCRNGAIPWPWLVYFGQTVEVDYCLSEMEWYQARPDKTTVIRFRNYVADLEQTLKTIYGRCLPHIDPTGFVHKDHVKRQRTGYSVDRSYTQLNIDENELLQPLEEYITWVEQSNEQ